MFKMEQVNVFGGSGFVGSEYAAKYPCVLNRRDNYWPCTSNLLYFISTVDNYNVFKDVHKDIDTNLNILMNVVERIKEPENTIFNFISSWFVYGNVALPAKETHPCDPRGFYSITKRAAEQLLISYCATMGMKYRILRLANVVGSNATKVSAKRNALQYMIAQLKNNETVQLYEGGYALRDFIHIDDCVDAINLVITKGKLNNIYNVGTGHPTKMREVIMTAKKMLRSKSEIEAIPTPEFHKIIQVRSMYLDVTKLFDLGFQPKYVTMEDWLPTLL